MLVVSVMAQNKLVIPSHALYLLAMQCLLYLRDAMLLRNRHPGTQWVIGWIYKLFIRFDSFVWCHAIGMERKTKIELKSQFTMHIDMGECKYIKTYTYIHSYVCGRNEGRYKILTEILSTVRKRIIHIVSH